MEKTSKERDEILYKFIHSSIRYLRMASRLEGLEYELKSLKKEFGIQESGCNRQEIIKSTETIFQLFHFFLNCKFIKKFEKKTDHEGENK